MCTDPTQCQMLASVKDVVEESGMGRRRLGVGVTSLGLLTGKVTLYSQVVLWYHLTGLFQGLSQ